MSTQTSGFSYPQLPEPLYRQLLAYQQHRGHDTLSAAVMELLSAALGREAQREEMSAVLAAPAPVELVAATRETPSATLEAKIKALEQTVASLTNELRQLRRESPSQLDRLREQLAAVRLSHSGLIQDLTRRLEALESTAFAPFHLQPDAIGLGSPVRDSAPNSAHAELLIAHGPIPENILTAKTLKGEPRTAEPGYW